MSLGKRLLVCFGVLLGVILVISGGGMLAVADLNADLEHAVKVTARQQFLAGEVRAAASEMSSLEHAGVVASMLSDERRAVEDHQRFLQARERVRKALVELERLSGAGSGRLKALDDSGNAVAEAHEELRRAVAAQKMDVALAIFAQKVQPRLEAIGAEASTLADDQARNLSAMSEGAASKASRVHYYGFGLIALALGAGGVVLWVLNQTSGGLKKLAARLAQSASQVASAASQVSSASRSLAQGSSRQAASLEQTAASTTEIVSITRNNADHAQQVALLMQESEQGTQDVNQTLGRMVEKMKEIDASSNKIARIIKVIDEIAFQTNILALNAAVEAARAGEAGLGFAVVADEVRSLAQRCADAAKDTAELIEESIVTSRDGNARLDQMAGAVLAVTGNAARVRILADQVSAGNQDQARGMEQISGAVSDMEQVTQATAAAAQESASAGTELDGHAAQLRALVSDLHQMVGAD